MKNERHVKTLLHAMAANAADVIAPVWPMKTIIACNPLQGLESMAFQEAVRKGDLLFGEPPRLSPGSRAENAFENDCLLAELLFDDEPGNRINEQLIKWLGAFLDEGQANIPMPGRSKGFYSAWRELAVYDRQLHRNSSSVLKWLKNLPAEAEDGLEYALRTLGKDEELWEDYLRLSLTKLNGWSGFIKWRSKNTDYKYQRLAPISLIGYLAVRLSIECCVVMAHLKIAADIDQPLFPQVQVKPGTRPPSIHHKTHTRTADTAGGSMNALMEAERAYRAPLLSQLQSNAKALDSGSTERKRPEAQLVFCIDVRSEPFRKALEAQGEYETFGFAGFFGLPIRFHSMERQEPADSCPALVKPRHDIYEEPFQVPENKLKKYYDRQAFICRIKDLYKQLKFNVATPFALAEGFGWWCGLLMLGQTLAPSRFMQYKEVIGRKLKSQIPTRPKIQLERSSARLEGIGVSEQVLYAEAFLRMIGLTGDFAPLVLLCGHGSKTENNPYASALDCGACGGNHGGVNSRVMAAILNDPKVRNALGARRIQIPDDTVFMGAEHNTTTDELVILDKTDTPHEALIQKLSRALTAAKESNCRYRLKNFGIHAERGSGRLAEARSNDWAQVRPEWGLACNAAFIVAPRQLTENMDLEGRCFLHSYDWRQDEKGRSLETILTAPMVVAQWINSQYNFSAFDNVAYGSGSKITHNVTGKFGVMQGNASDLMHGLPLQSVKINDILNYHEPLRLMTVVYAPREKVKQLVDTHEVLQKLFYKEWVALRVIEPATSEIYSLKTNGEWEAV